MRHAFSYVVSLLSFPNAFKRKLSFLRFREWVWNNESKSKENSLDDTSKTNNIDKGLRSATRLNEGNFLRTTFSICLSMCRHSRNTWIYGVPKKQKQLQRRRRLMKLQWNVSERAHARVNTTMCVVSFFFFNFVFLKTLKIAILPWLHAPCAFPILLYIFSFVIFLNFYICFIWLCSVVDVIYFKHLFNSILTLNVWI